jgi:hypothetical protein
MSSRNLWAALAAGLYVAFGLSGGAQAQSSVCPDNLRSYSALKAGEELKCTCRAEQMRGSVWGSGRYTTDSSVCRAAVHAGVIPADGGEVTLYKSEGCPSFVGTTANGVQTGNWGPYPQTFSFAADAPACAAPSGAVRACPASMAAYRGMAPGQVLTCSCTPQQFGGSIWGTGRYTADSSLCGAALHSGAIPATGGTVTVRTAPGCGGFQGSARNGIATQNWGSYNRTFAFAEEVPACAR